MAYSIEQGYFKPRKLDRTQRRLLISLPIIALLLAIGTLLGGNSGKNPSGQNTTRIPVVSTLSVSSAKPDNGSKDKNSGGTGSANSQPVGVGSFQGATPNYTGSTTGSHGTTVLGGMGSGPTGGTSGGGATSGGGTSGGGTTSTTLPDCSIGQIATVNCLVTACNPPVTLAPGQKAILGVNGTCVILN